MKKYFIVADVHGFYDELMAALEAKGFDANNPDHIFVSLGDLLDRGTQPFECLDFVLSLPEERRVLVMGNHELLMEQMIGRGGPAMHDLTNGTYETAEIITGCSWKEEVCEEMHRNSLWNEYVHSCAFYHEIGDNIFVHGWIPCTHCYDGSYVVNLKWREASIQEWKDATWINGMAAWAQGVKENGKTIWCGHWHTSWGHSHLHHDGVEFMQPYYGKECYEKFTPFKDKGICAMDACTAHTRFVNCEVIEVE